MPLVRIEVTKGLRSPTELRKLADTIQEVMLSTFKAPPKDRYQIITQHEKGDIICEDTNLGFDRTDELVFIQIFQQGRNAQNKQELYAALADRLAADCGLKKTDLIVSCSENKPEDWSFGMGQAQFLTGAL
ncbi:hypothetical protein MBLNU457_g1124t1 [Dothideomycetes sp. NU457]